MVRKLRAILLSLPLMSLCACAQFLSGIFPADISLTMARKDLSGSIPSGMGSSFGLSIVEADGVDWIILFTPSSYSGDSVFIFDPGLNLLQSYSVSALSTATTGLTLNGSYTMVDANGNVIIGNIAFTPSASTKTLSPLSTTIPALYNPCYAISATNNFYAMTSSGSVLSFSMTGTSWGTSSSFSPLIHPTSTTMSLANAFDDPSSGNVVLSFYDWSTSDNDRTVYYLNVTKGSTPSESLFEYYPVISVYKGTYWKKDGLTRDGIVTYNYDKQEFELLSFSSSASDKVVARFPMRESDGELYFAYSLSGGYYCTWDPSKRELVKKAAWWK